MSATTLKDLTEALARIDRPGSFAASGSVPAVLPGLNVEGLGTIGLPLTARQAGELKKLCHQAPYGKGEKTLVDKNVRRVWRMEPDRFALTNPDWNRFVAEIVAKVQEALGLEKQKLTSHLYDLLLYEPGSFFLSHKDGEKLDRMVATLVIVLPSTYQGGEIVVRHDGQEQTIDFSLVPNSAFQIHYAAFYADCEHEVRPLSRGHRLCLIYNLQLARSKKSIAAPRDSDHFDELRALLQKWAADDSAQKLAITLDHQYTKNGIAWDTLKGVDRARARVLAAAAREAGCNAYLSLLTLYQSGSAEDEYGGYGYRRRRKWYDEVEEEEEEGGGLHQMGEIFDTSLTAEHLVDSEGHGLPIGALHIDEDEVLDLELLEDVTPEEQFEGYTGNAGMTLERWYRHAAIIVWPRRRHFEILCDRDSRNIVPVLEQMVARWRKSNREKGKSPVLKEECLQLAAAILARWEERRFGRSSSLEPKAETLLKSLAELGDPALIGVFLGDVMVKDVSVDPGTAVAPVCDQHGWTTFQGELRGVMSSTNVETIERNVRLLEHLCGATTRKKSERIELCQTLAPELVAAIEAIDGSTKVPDWRDQEVNRTDVLASLAQALLLTQQPELLSRVVTHALALPKRYPLRETHLAALEILHAWLKKRVKKTPPALTDWVAACREQFESLTAQPPVEPTDNRRTANIACKCADCSELKRFLADPQESVHRFRMKQDRRTHLEQIIRTNRCDLGLHTDRSGSPQTLVCTKNTASYREKLKTYRQDLVRLATIRTIEANLQKRG